MTKFGPMSTVYLRAKKCPRKAWSCSKNEGREGRKENFLLGFGRTHVCSQLSNEAAPYAYIMLIL